MTACVAFDLVFVTTQPGRPHVDEPAWVLVDTVSQNAVVRHPTKADALANVVVWASGIAVGGDRITVRVYSEDGRLQGELYFPTPGQGRDRLPRNAMNS